MKYYVRVDEREYEIDIRPDRVVVDGEAVDVEWAQSGVPELYSLLLNGSSHEVVIEPQRNQYEVTLYGLHFQVRVEDEIARRLNAGRTAPAVPQGEMAVRAPIPGLIVKVLVEAGEMITEGQPLVILEAMKMENELRSPRAGEVKVVEAVAGHRVEQNAVLMILV